MAANDPTYAQTHDASSWSAADGSSVTNVLTCVTNGNTAELCVKPGKAPDDILRIEFDHLATIAVGDTITIWTNGLHQYVTMALIPYSTAGGVDTGNKITQTAASETIFTLTSGFIGALHDLGSGTWAARIAEDLGSTGDFQLAEVDSDLTETGGGGGGGELLLMQRSTQHGLGGLR